MSRPPQRLPTGIDEPSVFRTLFSAYPDALIAADDEGRIVLANPPAAQLLGYTVDELVGLNVDTLVPDSIRPRHAAYRHAYARDPRPRPMGTHMELVAKRKDGSEVMVEIGLSPLQDQGLPLVIAAIRDIGAFPRIKQALQRARYSEQLAQFGRLAVDVRDPQVLLERAPAIAAEALQAEAATVYLLEPDREVLRVAGGTAIPGEAEGGRVPNRPGTLPGALLAATEPLVVVDYRSERRFAVPPAYLAAGLVSGAGVALSDRGRTIGALTVRTREARRFGDDELRFLQSLASLLTTCLQRAQTEEALNHAQRLETVGQLTGGIAHDFNNLLTVIQGNLQVLEELPAVAADAAAPSLVSAAARAARRGAELTGKLLAFSRRQVLQPSAVDPATLLASLADMLRRTLDQRIRIEVDVAPACPPLLADPGQLESALLNIAINARDAMPDGGTLRFCAQPLAALPAALAATQGEASIAPAHGLVALAVADTGNGMSDAVKERAFEPFFTTKEAGRGTGLGLSTVYGFVRQSKGSIALDSVPGAGTTLTLYIPCAAPAPAPAVAAADDAAPRTLPLGLRVLLVEDDAEVRIVAERFLAALGCRVHAAASGEEALPLLDAAGPFDVLLTDVALGAGMRGTRLAREAEARQPGIGVLLTSGFSAELLQADQEAPPGWELLAKPYEREALAQAIARVLPAPG